MCKDYSKVLVTIKYHGDGADIFTMKVMTAAEWDDMRTLFDIHDSVTVTNEEIGGRTSDPCINARKLLKHTKVITDNDRISAVELLADEDWLGINDIYAIMERNIVEYCEESPYSW